MLLLSQYFSTNTRLTDICDRMTDKFDNSTCFIRLIPQRTLTLFLFLLIELKYIYCIREWVSVINRSGVNIFSVKNVKMIWKILCFSKTEDGGQKFFLTKLNRVNKNASDQSIINLIENKSFLTKWKKKLIELKSN